jgi:hypothetical protein
MTKRCGNCKHGREELYYRVAIRTCLNKDIKEPVNEYEYMVACDCPLWINQLAEGEAEDYELPD